MQGFRWYLPSTGNQRELCEFVQLTIGEGERFGVRIAGGTDQPVEPGVLGLFVAEVPEGGAAFTDGRIQPGDEILAVNEHEISPDSEHYEYVALLMESVATGTMSLYLKRTVDASYVDWQAAFNTRYGLVLPDGTEIEPALPSWEENMVFEVLKPEHGQGFGIGLVGEKKGSNNRRGVYIGATLANGIAKDSSLKHGMKLVEVNGWNMLHATVEDVADILAVSDTASIIAKDDPDGYMEFASDAFRKYYQPVGTDVSPSDQQTVVMTTSEDDRRIGMSLCGPQNGIAMVNSGIFVTAIGPDTAASRAEGLQPGTQILEVNGLNLYQASNEDAKNALLAAGTQITLKVVHNPTGLSLFEKEAAMLDETHADAIDVPRPTIEMPKLEDSSWIECEETVDVGLTRESSSDRLGIALTVYASGNHSDAVISVLFAGSPAAKTGLCKVGQAIRAVDGTSTLGMAQEQIISLLDGKQVTLTVSKHPVLPERIVLESGIVSYHADPTLPTRLVEVPADINGLGFDYIASESFDGAVFGGVYVTHIHQQGPSDLEIGDRILAVSSRVPEKFSSVAFMSQKDVTAALVLARAAGGQTYLVVAKDVFGFAVFSAVLSSTKPCNKLFAPTNTEELSSYQNKKQSLLEEDAPAATTSSDELQLPFFVQTFFSWPASAEDELSFESRDILEVLEFTSREQWRARHVKTDVTGMIPSPALYENWFQQTSAFQHILRLADEAAQLLAQTNDAKAIESTRAELTAIHSYGVVEKRTIGNAVRPVAIYGPFGDIVAVRAVRKLDLGVPFAQPLRCTSRERRENEVDGREYEFVPLATMKERLASNELVEVGSFKGNLYGTTTAAVAEPSRDGKLVLMHCHPPAIRRLQFRGDVHPLVIFVKPVSVDAIAQASTFLNQTVDAEAEFRTSAELELQFGQVFTHVVHLAGDASSTLDQVVSILENNCKHDFWALTPKSLPRRTLNDVGESIASLKFEVISITRGRDGKFGFEPTFSKARNLVQAVITGQPVYASDERLREGDVLVSLGGTSLVGENASKAKDLLRSSGDTVQAIVAPRIHSVRCVTLKKKDQGFGMTIQSHESFKGVIVGEVVPGSVADSRGVLVGDMILAINGRPMLTASHDNVLTVLKTETNVHLLLCPFSDVIETPVEHISANTKHVNLSPNANGFGLCVATSAESKYPFIERIKDKGAAAEHPKIATGDFIIEINGTSCAGVEYDQLISLLRRQASLQLVLRAPNTPQKQTSFSATPIPAADNVRTVELAREKTFGLTIIGDGDEPVVGEIIKGGPADRSGRVFEGDVIEKINGQPTRPLSHQEVVALFGSQNIVLQLRTPKTPTGDILTVKIVRSGQLGMQVSHIDGGHPRVTKVIEGGAIHKDGRIQEGDTLLSVNGTDMFALSHHQVVSALSKDGDIEFVVKRAQATFGSPTVKKETAFVDLAADRVVTLERISGQSLGMKIETQETPQPGQYPRIAEVIPKSPADSCASLYANDSIVEVNGVSMNGATKNDVTTALTATAKVTLKLVQHPLVNEEPSTTGTKVLTVEVPRGDDGYGVEIVTAEGESLPVIRSIVPGLPFAQAGVAEVGDRVVSINGSSVAGKSHSEVIDLLVRSESALFELLRERVVMHVKTMLPAGAQDCGITLKQGTGAHAHRLVVAEIAPSTIAHDSVLQEGDIITHINDTPTESVPVADIEAQINDSSTVVGAMRETLPADIQAILETSHLAQTSDLRTVEITKGDKRLGMRIQTDLSVSAYPSVVEVLPEGLAQECGEIFAGDQILEINGTSTSGLEHHQVIKLISENDPVFFVLKDGVVPESQPEPEQALTQESPVAVQEQEEEDGADVITLVRSERGLGVVVSVVAEVPFPIVTDVIEGTPAADSKLQKNSLITEINNERCDTLQYEGIISRLRQSDQVVLRVKPATEEQIAVIVAASQTRTAPAVEQAKDEEPEAATEEPEAATEEQPAAGRRELPHRFVSLDRSKGRLGLKIATPSNGGNKSLPVITDILEDGTAHGNDQIRQFDCIFAINGNSLRGIRHPDVIATMTSKNELELELGESPFCLALLSAEASSTPEQQQAEQGNFELVRLVSLNRDEKTGFGLNILHAEGTSMSHIGPLPKGRPADLSGSLQVGDAILAMNDTNVIGMAHADVLSLAREASTLVLRVATALPSAGEHKVELMIQSYKSHGLRLSWDDTKKCTIVAVDIGSAGAHAELNEGDVLTRINGMRVADLGDLVFTEEVLNSFDTNFAVCVEKAPAPVLALETETQAIALDSPSSDTSRFADWNNVRTAQISKGSNPLGLQIVTGDHSYPVVNAVIPNSLADQSGKFKANDVMLEINGTSTLDQTHDQILMLLTSLDELTVVVADPKEEEMRIIELDKSSSATGKLGMRIFTDDAGKTLIHEVVPGGAAHAEGSLKVNDIIVQINGEDVTSASHDHVTELLSSSDKLTLGVVAGNPLVAPEIDTELKTVTREAGQPWGMRVVSLGGVLGVLVSEIIDGSPCTGHIQANNAIFKINEQDVRFADHQAVVAMLGNSTTATFEVAAPRGEKIGVLNTNLGSLGLKVAISQNKARISHIVEGGQAQMDPCFALGDAIVSVNFADVSDKEPTDVIELLKSSTGIVAIGLNVDTSPIDEESSA